MSYYLTRDNQSEVGRTISAIQKLIMQKCESYNDPKMYEKAKKSFTDICTLGPWTDDPEKEKEFNKWHEFLIFLHTELNWSNFEEREFDVDPSIRAATEDDHFQANIRAYPALYNIATIYKFKPKSDIPLSNDGGSVSEEDAKNWAKALEIALDDIPDQKAEPLPEKVEEINSKVEAFNPDSNPESCTQFIEAIKTNPHASVLETFSGVKGKEFVREFIDFLKRGAYSTW